MHDCLLPVRYQPIHPCHACLPALHCIASIRRAAFCTIDDGIYDPVDFIFAFSLAATCKMVGSLHACLLIDWRRPPFPLRKRMGFWQSLCRKAQPQYACGRAGTDRQLEMSTGQKIPPLHDDASVTMYVRRRARAPLGADGTPMRW